MEHLTCQGCGISRTVTRTPAGRPRTPRGWKVLPTGMCCAACLRARYRILAVTVPIAGPIDRTWAELGTALRETWAETTRAANWIATELYARDVRREPSDTTLRPMPRVYLYPEVRALFPAISPINLTALIQQVEQTYRRRRYELLWQRRISLPTYRYPVPAPIHAQAWRLERMEGGAWIVHVRIREVWWALRLRGSAHFARQRAQLEAILSGQALAQAGAIYAVATVGNDEHGDARHAERGRRVMLKLVAWFPRAAQPRGTKTATVSTTESNLLVVSVPGRGVVHQERADHLRRRIASYEVRLARIAADLRVVRRWRASERLGLVGRLQRLGSDQRRTVRTLVQEAAAHVAHVCVRAGVSGVVYEDEARAWCDPFPWQALRVAVQHACEGQGLSWTYASGATGATDEGSARDVASEEVSA